MSDLEIYNRDCGLNCAIGATGTTGTTGVTGATGATCSTCNFIINY